uniref:Uncharacterized protein n=1 Tax=Palpitomonas bilix TaxID=652834 RepID=A0A7S3LY62_9EUKA|mmetsp:Transcript_9651/g.25985  ORF Transcript_9651/g.25985 Transcript_9651/m.25985 type:complete len:197 (+) Transcript_9651:185-775(+)
MKWFAGALSEKFPTSTPEFIFRTKRKSERLKKLWVQLHKFTSLSSLLKASNPLRIHLETSFTSARKSFSLLSVSRNPIQASPVVEEPEVDVEVDAVVLEVVEAEEEVDLGVEEEVDMGVEEEVGLEEEGEAEVAHLEEGEAVVSEVEEEVGAVALSEEEEVALLAGVDVSRLTPYALSCVFPNVFANLLSSSPLVL